MRYHFRDFLIGVLVSLLLSLVVFYISDNIGHITKFSFIFLLLVMIDEVAKFVPSVVLYRKYTPIFIALGYGFVDFLILPIWTDTTILIGGLLFVFHVFTGFVLFKTFAKGLKFRIIGLVFNIFTMFIAHSMNIAGYFDLFTAPESTNLFRLNLLLLYVSFFSLPILILGLIDPNFLNIGRIKFDLRKQVALIVGHLVSLPILLLFIFITVFGIGTENPIIVSTPTPVSLSELTASSPYSRDDNVVELPLSKYSNPANRFSGLRWWTEKIKEKNLYANIDIEYPQFIDGDKVADLNKYIRNLVLGRLEEDRDDVKKWLADQGGKPEDRCNQEPVNGTIWSCGVLLQSEYKVNAIVNDTVSIELILTDYTGGGNGNHDEPVVINWDLKSNKLLKSEEIFCNDDLVVNQLSSLASESILNQYQFKNPVADKRLADDTDILVDDVRDRTLEPNNYSNILIGYSGITVIFSPYSVLGGAAGIVRAFIPYSSIPGVVCLP